MGDRGEWIEVTDEDRRAPREGDPIDVWVSVSYRQAGDDRTYHAVLKGRRWPTGAGSVSRGEHGWIEVRATAWMAA